MIVTSTPILDKGVARESLADNNMLTGTDQSYGHKFGR